MPYSTMPRFLYSFLLLWLLVAAPALGQRPAPDADYLNWSATRRLTAADFQMKPQSSQNLNGSMAMFSYSLDGNIGQLLGKRANDIVRARMLRTASWLDTATATQQLRYQQTLFDIEELYTRRFRQQARANARRILLVGKPDINALLDAEMKAAQLRQATYAEETNYGVIPEKQAAWEQQIFAELQQLQDYQATE
jgi:hypothetical protein